MSTKIYNGIRFKSRNFYEVVSQLYDLKKQAIANSVDELVGDPFTMVRFLKNKFNDDFDIEALKDPYNNFTFECLNALKSDLDDRLRSSFGIDFNCSVNIIPHPNGNIYGYVFNDRIQQNYDLLLSIADEYGYQNQTDKPDEISEEEWDERRNIWNIIFDKYFTFAEAGPKYDLVSSFDLETEHITKAINSYFDLTTECHIFTFKLDDKQSENKELIKAFVGLENEYVHVVDLSWFSSCPIIEVAIKFIDEKSELFTKTNKSLYKVMNKYNVGLYSQTVERRRKNSFNNKEIKNKI